MGTNYYWFESGYNAEDDPSFGLHIGKSSGGWAFTLHIHPRREISTLLDWERKFKEPGSFIKDEYGRVVPPSKMKEIIRERSHPQGLRRHDVDGKFCVGHGDGTWDYCVGDFC